MPNGYASFTTSSGNDAKGTNHSKMGEATHLVTKGEKINNAKILSTLAKYLWMKDNTEFRLRVLTAMGFLIGAKVSKDFFLLVFVSLHVGYTLFKGLLFSLSGNECSSSLLIQASC